MFWECAIPGKVGTLWEGGLYKLTLKFESTYPATAPKCQFSTMLPHPNIFPSGSVCLSIIGSDWKPSITIKQILLGIQELLTSPNPKSPANEPYYHMYRSNLKHYEQTVREFAAKNKPKI